MTRTAVLEVGGTHAAASWVDQSSWQVVPGPAGRAAVRAPVRADGTADEILDALAACVDALGSLAGAPLAVAMPGPFDYAAGVGAFVGVGKFDALAGVDVGAGLLARLLAAPERIVFVNDAAAFGLGEWLVGAARDSDRAVAITLGSGIGSAFVDDGVVASSGPTVPPDGHVYRLEIDGNPLESVVSRRAILAAYTTAGGEVDGDVRDIAERAAAGDPVAHWAFTEPLRRLGSALAPWLTRFGAQVLVVGGAMSESWTLVEPALREGLRREAPVLAQLPIRRATNPDAATAIGAAWHAGGGVEPPARIASALTRGDER